MRSFRRVKSNSAEMLAHNSIGVTLQKARLFLEPLMSGGICIPRSSIVSSYAKEWLFSVLSIRKTSVQIVGKPHSDNIGAVPRRTEFVLKEKTELRNELRVRVKQKGCDKFTTRVLRMQC